MVASTETTCGNCLCNSALTTLDTRIDSSSDADGMFVTRNWIVPSCSVGMNSLPRNGNNAREATSNATAEPMTSFLRSSAQSSSGR